MIKSATRSEWCFVVICAIVMLVLTSLPYLFGYLTSPADKVFMGIAYGTPDTAQYFAWMRGFRNAILIDNHLTPEPNAVVFFNLQWWALAKLAVVFNLSFTQVFQVFRILCGIAFAFVSYWFIALFLENLNQRRVAFLLANFGAGLGWLWVVVKYIIGDLLYPFDVYTVEPNSFLSIMAFPHFTAAAVLIIAILGSIVLGYEQRAWRYLLLAGVMALILGLSHAYDLLLIYAIVGLFTVLIWLRDGFSLRLLLYPVALVLISCWPAFYSVYITTAFPVWKAVLAQFVNAGAWTPDPFHLLFLLGVPFIAAILGYDGFVPLRGRSLPDIFVRTWFVANLFLVYVPLNFQIHYLNGWQIPIAILATAVFYRRILPWLRRRRPVWLTEHAVLPAILFISLALPTNLYLLAWRFVDLGRYQHPYFLHRDEAAALNWLAAHATTEQVILSEMGVGQYIAGQVGARPFLGHWAMTKNLYEKQDMVRAFFDLATPDVERQAILSDFDVDYVFIGLDERDLGEFDPATVPYLEPCFTASEASVYCVRLEELAKSSVAWSLRN